MSVRDELDSQLGVRRWPVPGGAAVIYAEVEPGTPSWWQGDEDASQSFLTAMGVHLE